MFLSWKAKGNGIIDVNIFYYIEKALKIFNIDKSLSTKGCPCDNALVEATYKIIKTEFAFNKRFESLEKLELELFDYVN